MQIEDYPSIQEFKKKSRFVRGEYTAEEVIEIIEGNPLLSEAERIQAVDKALGDVSIVCDDCGQLTKYGACSLYYLPVPKKNNAKKLHLCSKCVKKRKTKELKQSILCYIISFLLIAFLIYVFLTKL